MADKTADDAGIRGVRLAKELMAVAGRTLKANMTTLGPQVLPLSEKVRGRLSGGGCVVVCVRWWVGRAGKRRERLYRLGNGVLKH